MEVSSEAETLFRLSDELLEFVDGFETQAGMWPELQGHGFPGVG